MLIAQEKRKTNLAEYILYLWQVEDLIRALNFDMERINKELVERFRTNEEKQLEIYGWYKNLVVMMEKEQILQNGHLQFISNLVDELNEFHLLLLQSGKDPAYAVLFGQAKPLLDEFRMKSNDVTNHDIHVAFSLLYSILLLRLQQKQITPETEHAAALAGQCAGHLAARYKQAANGEFEF